MPRGVPNKVRTPGVPEGDAAAADAVGSADEVVTDQPRDAAAGLVTLTPDQLQAHIDRAVLRAMASRNVAESEPRTGGPLPDQASVDPKKIRSMVLTRQGYVIPEKMGEPANAAAKLA